jgi:D-hydroxyproline dehydrogenase subunit beta
VTTDLLVIGAGMVGSACAYYCTEAGLRVAVVDRGPVAGGTTSSGEGNILVSDKEPGAELELALLSVRLWAELGERIGAGSVELEPKGGVVVARSAEAAGGLAKLTAAQREYGVEVTDVGPAELAELEPNLTTQASAACSAHRRASVTGRPRCCATPTTRSRRGSSCDPACG